MNTVRISHPLRRAQRRAQAGITLVETMTVTAVLAIVASVATPGFNGSVQRRHLEGAVAQLETDIHYTRSLAVARNQPLRISFASDAAASCYVIHTGTANQCACAADGSAVCQGSAEALRSVRFAAAESVGLSANARSVLVDPVRGTVTPTATVQFRADNGMALNQVVNILGRVRTCSPGGTLSGHPRC
jgi:type IV fimbrial biogenesis protein FimT